MVVFELFKGVVGFEDIHSSFPKRKRSPEYAIFSKMKSYLKLRLLWNLWSSFNCLTGLWLSGLTWSLLNSLLSSNSSKAWLSLNSLSSLNSSVAWSSLNCSTGLQLSGLEFFRLLFEGVLDSTCTSIGSFPQTSNLSSLLHAFWHCLLGTKIVTQQPWTSSQKLIFVFLVVCEWLYLKKRKKQLLSPTAVKNLGRPGKRKKA